MNLENALGLYNYWIVIVLMMTGFYIVIARKNMIKTVIGLNIFQTSVFLLYITMGKVVDGTAPIIPPAIVAAHDHAHAALEHADAAHAVGHAPHSATEAHSNVGQDAVEAASAATDLVYSNPLPSVLMLTAIVVGIATTAVALSLIVRIREDYGTIEEDEVLAMDRNE